MSLLYVNSIRCAKTHYDYWANRADFTPVDSVSALTKFLTDHQCQLSTADTAFLEKTVTRCSGEGAVPRIMHISRTQDAVVLNVYTIQQDGLPYTSNPLYTPFTEQDEKAMDTQQTPPTVVVEEKKDEGPASELIKRLDDADFQRTLAIQQAFNMPSDGKESDSEKLDRMLSDSDYLRRIAIANSIKSELARASMMVEKHINKSADRLLAQRSVVDPYDLAMRHLIDATEQLKQVKEKIDEHFEAIAWSQKRRKART